MQSICQSGETRLKSEKARTFITTPSTSVPVEDHEYGQLIYLLAPNDFVHRIVREMDERCADKVITIIRS